MPSRQPALLRQSLKCLEIERKKILYAQVMSKLCPGQSYVPSYVQSYVQVMSKLCPDAKIQHQKYSLGVRISETLVSLDFGLS